MINNRDKTKQKLGIIGGGQLGKMMILEAKKMGFYIVILDPTLNCPAHSIADQHLVADFDDEKAIREMADLVDIITYEFEHIGVEILKDLEREGHRVYPTARSLEVIQDKFRQKEALSQAGIPVPSYMKIKEIEDISKAGDRFNYPLMLKSCTGGYDGKGNDVINRADDILTAFESLGGGTIPLMVEEFIPYTKEISVLACRGIEGEVAIYPVGENEHRENILFETRVPAGISSQLSDKARQLAREVMEVFQGVGMFCVEMFVTEGEQLYINEVAPRPHNSGHYTIEGCVTSQFEQHIRAITGLPLGNTALHQSVVMRNILGEGKAGKAVVIGLEEALKISDVKVHIYGKEISRPGRKMGHLTVTAPELEEALRKICRASELIRITGEH